MPYNNKGYKIRARYIQRITQKYYEPENHAKCYKQVWKQHIYPLMGINYRSYLRYLNENEDFKNRNDDDFRFEVLSEV